MTGKKLNKGGPTFSDSFGDTMLELAEENPRLCAITAAMPGGTGLLKYMRQYPSRFFDVGIAEEHAVSMAGGLAKQGMVPVVAIYSTFLQRAYDQIMQDIAMLHLHVVFAIDRAGLVGDDGPTHHGVFDVGFLRQVPGMLILAPASLSEQRAMLRWAVEEYDGPVAIRFPRGSEGAYTDSAWNVSGPDIGNGVFSLARTGKDLTILTYGTLCNAAMAAAQALSQQGIEATVLRLLTPSALPVAEIAQNLSENPVVVVLEEVSANSGVRDALSYELHRIRPDCRVSGIDLGGSFVPHGAQAKLYGYCGLDCDSIVTFAKEAIRDENQKETGCSAD